MNINQNRVRRPGQLLALLSILVASSAAFGAGNGFAYANNPTGAQYTPHRAYSFNSTRGAISIRRAEKGVYAVTFAGLGGNGTAGGHVQVSAYGSGSEYCKVASWDSGRQDFIVNVRCFTARGAPADTSYTVSAIWPQPIRSIAPALQQLRPESQSFSQAAPNLGQASSSFGATPQSSEVSREILPDGRVKITYADGSYKVIGPSGYTFFPADGPAEQFSYRTQAPPPNPPSPPAGSQEANWLAAHADGLLTTISQLVDFNQQSIDNYLAAEGNVDVYAKIVKRRVTLDYMVNE